MPAPAAPSGSGLVVGLISGTSADGVDAALCRVARGGDPAAESALQPGAVRVELVAARTTPYAADVRERVLAAAELRVPELAALDAELGEVFARAAEDVCLAAGVRLGDVELLSSHGQTVWHDADGEIAGRRATLQIGRPAVIAALTGCDVVADFRPGDVALGGQGAPLVPLADFLLLERPGTRRAVLNLGGIGNVTWLAGTRRAEDVRAFDTGPGNMVLDGLVRRYGLRREGFDVDGALALAGEARPALVEELLAEPFFRRAPPRSTGRERFGAAYVERLATRGEALGLSPEDLLASAAALTARAASASIREHCGTPDEVLLCGGGRRNRAVRARLREALPRASLRDTDDEGVDGDAKEATAFALLGWLASRGLPNHLPHTTGAARRLVLGSLVRGRAA